MDFNADNLDITLDLSGQHSDPYGGVPAQQDGITPNAVNVSRELPAEKGGNEDGKEPSVRDMLSDAFKGTPAPKADANEVPADQKPAVDPNAPPAEAPVLTKIGDRYHTADGKFASAEQIAAFEAAQAAAPQNAAPNFVQGMTPAERTQLEALPAELRQFVERTMEATANSAERYKEYDLIEQVIGQRREPWAQQGMSPAAAIGQLFALSDFAGSKPADFVLWFAEQNGIDLDQVLDDRDAAAELAGEQASDPRYSGLVQQVQQMSQQLQQMTGNSEQQRHAQHLEYVQQFANTADSDGNPAYPYFARVAGTLQPFLAAEMQRNPQGHPLDNLKAAYSAAIWADPTIRAEVQKKEQAARDEAERARAAAAAHAGASVQTAPAGGGKLDPGTGELSLRDELKRNFAKYGEGN